jgi:hypothetical protein
MDVRRMVFEIVYAEDISLSGGYFSFWAGLAGRRRLDAEYGAAYRAVYAPDACHGRRRVLVPVVPETVFMRGGMPGAIFLSFLERKPFPLDVLYAAP